MSRRAGQYTPTQYRMVQILEDWLPHTTEELAEALGDELTPQTVIKQYVFRLKKRLPAGLAIKTIQDPTDGRRRKYQLVRVMAPVDE